MSSSSPIPSIPILSGRAVAVIVGVATLVLLALGHGALLRLGMAKRRAAEEHIRSRVERHAAFVGERLRAIRTRAVGQAESEELQAVLAQSSPAAKSRAEAVLQRLVQPDSIGSPTPFAKAILRSALGEDLAVATTPQDALLPGQAPVPDGPVPPVPLSAPGRRWRLGSTRLSDGVLRLVLAAEVPIKGRAAGQLLLVFTRDLAHFLGALPPCGGQLATSALGLRRVGVFACVGDGLESSQFAELLQAERDCTTAFDVELPTGQTVHLVGRWTVVSGTPLVFAHALAERGLGGGFSPGLPRASLLVSSAFVCVLLIAFVLLSRRYRRTLGEHADLVAVDLDLQHRLHEYERAEVESQRLTSAVDGAGEAVMTVDRDGRLTYVNRAFERLFGLVRAESLGRRLAEFMPPDEVPRLEPAMLAGTCGTLAMRMRCRHRDGDRLLLGLTVSPVCDAAGEVVHYLILARDVRDEMALEERSLQARKLAAVGRLAGGMAHEFNNVLQVILGYAGEMAESVRDPDLRESLSQILTAGQRGSELTGRLVAFSQQQVSQREPGSLNDVVRAQAETIQKRLGTNADLQLLLGDGLWTVALDGARIGQALVHLAERARGGMPNGGTLTISTGNVTFEEPLQTLTGLLRSGEYGLLRMQDTGLGISPENIEHIFEPVFSSRSQGVSRGLGLSIVHGTIAQHEGGIVVESGPGCGTSFDIYLPRGTAVPGEDVIDDAELPPQQSGLGQTILLAEDEEPVRHVTARLLAKAGYEVIEAADGREAIAEFEAQGEQIDLALLDIVMPEMSGAAVADYIRRNSPETPILFCSGYAKRQLPEDIALPEDIPLIGKPYEPHHLLDAIAGLLAPSSSGPVAPAGDA